MVFRERGRSHRVDAIGAGDGRGGFSLRPFNRSRRDLTWGFLGEPGWNETLSDFMLRRRVGRENGFPSVFSIVFMVNLLLRCVFWIGEKRERRQGKDLPSGRDRDSGNRDVLFCIFFTWLCYVWFCLSRHHDLNITYQMRNMPVQPMMGCRARVFFAHARRCRAGPPPLHSHPTWAASGELGRLGDLEGFLFHGRKQNPSLV